MLNLFAPINTLGIGTHAYHLARQFEALGNEICLVPPLGQVRFEDESVQRWLLNRERFSANDPSLMIFDIPWFTQFSGNPRIGFAVFETDGFTKIQLAALRSCDWLLTPSAWARRVLSDHGINSFVVREGFDPEEFKCDLNPRHPEDIFRFVNVGKLEERKGTLQLIRCFFLALEREDAELFLHCENKFDPAWSTKIHEFLTSHGFRMAVGASGQTHAVYTRGGLRVVVNHAELPSTAPLYAQADCGIFPSKGEGWGLPILECVASGVPAIVGNWTGHSEFLGPNYPYELTIKSPMKITAYDGHWYLGDRGDWYAPMDEELIELIRHAFHNARALRASKAWADNVIDFRRFTWIRAAVELTDFLSII